MPQPVVFEETHPCSPTLSSPTLTFGHTLTANNLHTMNRDTNKLLSISDSSHQWVLVETVYNWTPLFIRFNRTAQKWGAHPDLPVKLGFTIPLTSPSEHGLPSSDENELLHTVEDAIIREVEAQTNGINVLALTTGTMKEFVFYIPIGVDIKTIHESIQQTVSTHEVQCMAVNRPDWRSYTRFTPDWQTYTDSQLTSASTESIRFGWLTEIA